jgi:septal ring factor EnvC (AmiA/AmiB activator)
MRSTVTSPTLKLATARLEFRSDRRLKEALHLAAVAALIFLFVMIGRRLYVDSHSSGAELTVLRQRNATLRADLSRTQIELELERSTRAALARQVADLNEETSRLKSRLGFFDAQIGRPDNTR